MLPPPPFTLLNPSKKPNKSSAAATALLPRSFPHFLPWSPTFYICPACNEGSFLSPLSTTSLSPLPKGLAVPMQSPQMAPSSHSCMAPFPAHTHPSCPPASDVGGSVLNGLSPPVLVTDSSKIRTRRKILITQLAVGVASILKDLRIIES